MARGADHQRRPDWWQATDGRWYPPAEQVRQRQETAKEIALVAGVLLVVTLLTLLALR